MKYKKLLFTILVIILVMLTLMLATSYAWYSFNTGSTTFNAVTNNSDVSIDFVKGDYINNNAAIPISRIETMVPDVVVSSPLALHIFDII